MNNEQVNRSDSCCSDSAAQLARLRNHVIERRIGMVAAARLLAEETARLAIRHIEKQRVEGVFRQKLINAPDGATADVVSEIVTATVALIIGRIRVRGQHWLREAIQLEAEAKSLEQNNRDAFSALPDNSLKGNR